MQDEHIFPAEGDGPSPSAIDLTGISKSFGSVKANDNISLTVKSGSIHGIVGENGAGKSTLVSILYGFYQADSGRISIDGDIALIRFTSDAIGYGIGMVHQHFMLVSPFTVLENIILGHENKLGGRNLKTAISKARDELMSLSARYGLVVDLDAVIGDLSVGLQQRVEILKALYRGAKILILDEPTGVLTPQETDQLFEILNLLRSQGVTILFITHKLREIMAVTDYVSVMRGGQMVSHLKTEETTASELAELMVGREVSVHQVHEASDIDFDTVCLRADDISLMGANGRTLLHGINFDLHAGEILGIAGISGNGQTELLSVLSGILPLSGGIVQIGDTIMTPTEPLTPKALRKLGVAHVPEDRQETGLVMPFTAAESSILGYEKNENCVGSGLFMNPRTISSYCMGLMETYDIRPQHPDLKSNLFSGGNQQKIVLARELTTIPKILLVGQPTRGVDIGAIEFIHQELLKMRDEGCAILIVSVELDEILSLSDRIMVMNNGTSMGIVQKKDADAHSIGLLMAGVAA